MSYCVIDTGVLQSHDCCRICCFLCKLFSSRNSGASTLITMSTDEQYVCTLTEASLEKATKELFEDPKERIGAVNTFRTWILQQSHITCPTGEYHIGHESLTPVDDDGSRQPITMNEVINRYLWCHFPIVDGLFLAGHAHILPRLWGPVCKVM